MKILITTAAVSAATLLAAGCASDIERTARDLHNAEAELAAVEPDRFTLFRQALTRFESAQEQTPERRSRYATAERQPAAEAASAANLEAAAPAEYKRWTHMVAILEEEPYWIEDPRTVRLIGLRRNALAGAAPDAFAAYVAASPFRMAEDALLANVVGMLFLADVFERLSDELQRRQPVLMERWAVARLAHQRARAESDT